MNQDESLKRLRRLYAKQRLLKNPGLRHTFDRSIELLRTVLDEPEDEAPSAVLATAAIIAAELEVP